MFCIFDSNRTCKYNILNTMYKNKTIVKYLRQIVWIIGCTLFTVSLVTVIFINIDFIESGQYCILNTKTIRLYLSLYASYDNLFTATITVITIIFALEQIEAAIKSNAIKVKQDRFIEWRTIMDCYLLEVAESDPLMKREFIKRRIKLYDKLIEYGFVIRDRKALEDILAKIFDNKVISFFETNNSFYLRYQKIYPNDQFSYSYDSFCFLFLGGLDDLPNNYSELKQDLEKIYIGALDSDRKISEQDYNDAKERYAMRLR